MEIAIGVVVAIATVYGGWVFEERTKKAASWDALGRRTWNGLKLLVFGSLVIVILLGAATAAYQFFFAEQWMQASFTSWDRGPRDHLVLHFVTLKNTSNNLIISDPVLSCDAIGNSGTTIQSVSATVYEKVPPNDSITVPRLELETIPEQASNVHCSVRNATWLESLKR